MGLKYLWDTNVVAHFLQESFEGAGEELIDGIVSNYTPVISIVTEIELLCWKKANESDVSFLKNFISDSIIFELTQEIKLETIEIRKSYSIKLPDAIIAATAIIMDLTLISNDRGFSKIPALKVLNPFKLL